MNRRRWGDGVLLPGATHTASALHDTAVDRTRRVVAGRAIDVDDCRVLLDMLGIGFSDDGTTR